MVHSHAIVNKLVAEVGAVLVVSTQVPIVGGCGAEEDCRRQVVSPVLEELIHLTGHARLNSHSVS